MKARLKLTLFSIALACVFSPAIQAGTNSLDAKVLGNGDLRLEGVGDPLAGTFLGPINFTDFLTFTLPSSAPRWDLQSGELVGPGKWSCSLLGLVCTAGFSNMQLSLEHKVAGSWQVLQSWNDNSTGPDDRIAISFGSDLGLLESGDYGLKITGTGRNGLTQSPQYRVNILAAPVPEPETYALLLAGLGLVGTLARRGRRQAG